MPLLPLVPAPASPPPVMIPPTAPPSPDPVPPTLPRTLPPLHTHPSPQPSGTQARPGEGWASFSFILLGVGVAASLRPDSSFVGDLRQMDVSRQCGYPEAGPPGSSTWC